MPPPNIQHTAHQNAAPSTHTPHHTYSPPHKQQNQHHTPTKTNNAEPPPPQEPLIDGLSEKQSKYNKHFLGLVMPSRPALAHPAAPMLVEFATAGCDATINTQWTLETIEAAITRGAHPSTQLPEPIAQL